MRFDVVDESKPNIPGTPSWRGCACLVHVAWGRARIRSARRSGARSRGSGPRAGAMRAAASRSDHSVRIGLVQLPGVVAQGDRARAGGNRGADPGSVDIVEHRQQRNVLPLPATSCAACWSKGTACDRFEASTMSMVAWDSSAESSSAWPGAAGGSRCRRCAAATMASASSTCRPPPPGAMRRRFDVCVRSTGEQTNYEGGGGVHAAAMASCLPGSPAISRTSFGTR